MLSKVLAIAWNGIYRTYTDRIAFLFMFITPIVLSLIIGAAFGGESTDINLPQSEIEIINLDEGYTTSEGRQANLGQQNYVDVLITNSPEALSELITASESSDVEQSRQKVEDGEIRAALIIPPDFSEKTQTGQGELELYYNPRSEIAVTVLISILEQLTNNANMGQVAQEIYVGQDGYFIQHAMASGAMDKIEPAAEEALTRLFTGETGRGITLTSASITGEQQDFDSLGYFAPSMAILFMTFAMAGGTRSILWEQQHWITQRILTTPTPRWVYMVGRLLGTYVSGVVQMLILLLVTPLIAVLLGRDADVWGNNYLGLALLSLSVVAAGTGLGLFIASFSKTETQADTISSAVVILMGVLGGSFVPIEVGWLNTISNLSLNKWGINGFNDLANNDAVLIDILPNVAVLVGMAILYFVIGLQQFNRRLDV